MTQDKILNLIQIISGNSQSTETQERRKSSVSNTLIKNNKAQKFQPNYQQTEPYPDLFPNPEPIFAAATLF